MTITKRDAQQLVDEIKRAKISAHVIAQRTGLAGSVDAAFLGGLESVLQHFLRLHGCMDAAAAVPDAMNRPPTDAEMAVRNAQIDGMRSKAAGATPC